MHWDLSIRMDFRRLRKEETALKVSGALADSQKLLKNSSCLNETLAVDTARAMHHLARIYPDSYETSTWRSRPHEEADDAVTATFRFTASGANSGADRGSVF